VLATARSSPARKRHDAASPIERGSDFSSCFRFNFYSYQWSYGTAAEGGKGRRGRGGFLAATAVAAGIDAGGIEPARRKSPALAVAASGDDSAAGS
jgi:hypothetical protein